MVATGQVAETTHYYFIYLFLLHRVASTLRLGSGDASKWYLRAAEEVVDAQAPGGYWGGANSSPTKFEDGRLRDTCFAVLFLLGQAVPRSQLVPARDRSAQPTPR